MYAQILDRNIFFSKILLVKFFVISRQSQTQESTDYSWVWLCRLIMKNFTNKIFEKSIFLQRFCAYMYDFKGILREIFFSETAKKNFFSIYPPIWPKKNFFVTNSKLPKMKSNKKLHGFSYIQNKANFEKFSSVRG